MRRHLIAVDSPKTLHRRLFGNRTRVVAEGVSSEILSSLRSFPFVQEIQCENGEIVIEQDDPESGNPVLIAELVKQGAVIKWVTDDKASLEDIYLELVDETSGERGRENQ